MMIKKIKIDKKISSLSLNLFIFKIKQEYKFIKDHSLLAFHINQKFKLNITKEDIDEFYGFNDIYIENFEDESRKHYFKMKI